MVQAKINGRVNYLGPILCKKAVQLEKKVYGEESSFSESTEW